MRKEVVVTLLLIGIFVIAIVAILVTLSKTEVLLSPMPEIYKPKDCSNSEIIKEWDSIFEESSSGVYVIINQSIPVDDECLFYIAYKIIGDEAYILYAVDMMLSSSTDVVTSFNGKFEEPYLDILRNLKEDEEDPEILSEITSFFSDEQKAQQYIKTRQISSESEAESEFDSKYKVESGTWGYYETLEFPSYYFLEGETNEGGITFIRGIVYTDYSLNGLTYSNISEPSQNCVTDWTAKETPCNSSERKTIYYVPSNICSNKSGMPDNETVYCDFDSNNILGHHRDIDENIVMEIHINNTMLDYSQTYEGEKEVKIFDGDKSIIEFDWNFTEAPLDLRDIKIEKQPFNSWVGYLIVNGINASKTIKVEKLSGFSKSVCLVDREIDKIDRISSNCTGNDEVLVKCPGSSGEYGCQVSGGMYVITGLKNSVAIELSLGSDDGLCIPNWECEEWSQCIKGNQARKCFDLNNCNDDLTRPPQIQHCEVCIPRWECSDWLPKECPEERLQTRNCNDQNHCETDKNKPPTSRECERLSLKWILIILGAMITIIAVGWAITFFSKKKVKRKKVHVKKKKHLIRRRPPERVKKQRVKPAKKQHEDKAQKKKMTLEEAKKIYSRDIRGYEEYM